MTPAPTSAKLKLMLCPPLACAHGPRCARCVRSCCAVLEHALMALAALGAFAHAVLSLCMRSWPSLRSVHSLMLVPPCACAHGPRCARCIRSCSCLLVHALMALAALGAFAHAVLSLSMRSWPSLRSVHSLMLCCP